MFRLKFLNIYVFTKIGSEKKYYIFVRYIIKKKILIKTIHVEKLLI